MIVELVDYVRKRNEGVLMNKTLHQMYKKDAQQLLMENGISLNPPIDLDKLVNKLGVSIREHDFGNVEEKTGLEKDSILGATLLNEDHVMILYKKYQEKRNNHGKRFTIAHELGHCVLHAEDLTRNHLELRSDLYNKNNSREMAASRFAGELLIPEVTLHSICKQLIIPSLSVLAEIFDVSTAVMRERLKEVKIKYIEDAV